MVKFYQKLHLFRVNELPLILSPLCCSQDLILWQCILDVIIKKRISCVSKRSEICKSGGVRKMSAVSENAVRYTAGSVMRKLLEMYKSDTEVTECLRSMLKGGDDIIEHRNVYFSTHFCLKYTFLSFTMFRYFTTTFLGHSKQTLVNVISQCVNLSCQLIGFINIMIVARRMIVCLYKYDLARLQGI